MNKLDIIACSESQFKQLQEKLSESTIVLMNMLLEDFSTIHMNVIDPSMFDFYRVFEIERFDDRYRFFKCVLSSEAGDNVPAGIPESCSYVIEKDGTETQWVRYIVEQITTDIEKCDSIQDMRECYKKLRSLIAQEEVDMEHLGKIFIELIRIKISK